MQLYALHGIAIVICIQMQCGSHLSHFMSPDLRLMSLQVNWVNKCDPVAMLLHSSKTILLRNLYAFMM